MINLYKAPAVSIRTDVHIEAETSVTFLFPWLLEEPWQKAPRATSLFITEVLQTWRRNGKLTLRVAAWKNVKKTDSKSLLAVKVFIFFYWRNMDIPFTKRIIVKLRQRFGARSILVQGFTSLHNAARQIRWLQRTLLLKYKIFDSICRNLRAIG